MLRCVFPTPDGPIRSTFSPLTTHPRETGSRIFPGSVDGWNGIRKMDAHLANFTRFPSRRSISFLKAYSSVPRGVIWLVAAVSASSARCHGYRSAADGRPSQSGGHRQVSVLPWLKPPSGMRHRTRRDFADIVDSASCSRACPFSTR